LPHGYAPPNFDVVAKGWRDHVTEVFEADDLFAVDLNCRFSDPAPGHEFDYRRRVYAAREGTGASF
jgi:hypothetical protein